MISRAHSARSTTPARLLQDGIAILRPAHESQRRSEWRSIGTAIHPKAAVDLRHLIKEADQ